MTSARVRQVVLATTRGLPVDLLLLLAYAGSVLLGRATVIAPSPLALVWPAAGVAVLWAVLARHRGHGTARVLVLIALGSAGLNAATGAPPSMAVVLGMADALQAAVAVAVLDRLRPADWRLRRAADLAPVVAATVIGAAASALLVALAAAALLGTPVPGTAAQWLLRNGGSMLVLLTIGLLAADAVPRRRPHPAARLERLACHTAQLASCTLVFGLQHGIPMSYTLLPVAMWAGTRLPTRLAALHALFAAVAATAGTLAGRGPFADSAWALAQQPLLLHGFLVVVVLITVLLALDRDERSVLAFELAARSAELERSEQHYRLVAEHAGDAIGRIAADGSVLWTSPSTDRVFGLEAAHVQGSARADVVHPDDLAAVAAATDSVFSGREPGATVRFRVPQVGGGVRWMESHLTPVRAEGRVVEVVTLARDVTEQTRREQLLAEAYEDTARVRMVLQTAIDAMVDAFLVHQVERDLERPGPDGLGEVVAAPALLANAAAASRLGVPADDLVGADLRALVPEGAPYGLWDRLVEAVTSGRPQSLRIHHEEHGAWARSEDLTLALCAHDQVVVLFRDASADERQLRDISQDRETAVHAAHHDALTGLPNRTALAIALDTALDECRVGELVAVVFVDLDGFKAVNDTWGHAAGDTVLQTAAQRLSGLVRSHDTAARLAGDEFVLVMRHVPGDWSSAAFFDRARSVLSHPVPVLVARTDGGGPGLVTVRPGASFGLVLADPHDPAGSPRADELLALADARMYEQKRDRKAVSAVATTVRG